jgi:hypothetical protein
MSYVDSVLQPGERIIMRGHLHWIVYWQCAPKARITSGGRFHPESCRLIW